MENEEGLAELESGYSPEPAAEPVVEEKVEEVVEQPVVEEVKPDPIADLKTYFDDKFSKIESRTRNTEGHIGGLNHNLKQLQETLTASKAAAQTVSEAPSQAQVKEAMSNPQEWEALKNDFPEWATATEKFMDAKLGSIKPQVDMSAFDQRIAETKSEISSIRREANEATLDAVFPDWRDEVNTPEFGKWIGSQPEDVQALGASPHVRDAARMLRLFEQSKNQKAPPPVVNTRQKRIEAAVTPKGSGGFTPAASEMDEFEAGYNSR